MYIDTKCVLVQVWFPRTYFLQAYRLEPLVNSAYERVKSVKIDRCNAGPSGTAQELASGPRSAEIEPPQKKGGWMSYLPSMGKVSVVASETAVNASAAANNMDKKVCISSKCFVVILSH